MTKKAIVYILAIIFILVVLTLSIINLFVIIEVETSKPQIKDFGKLVLAFYYPWYGTPNGSAGSWRHWSDPNHDPNRIINGRRDLASAHYPLIGPYDSMNDSVIEYHLKLAEYAGIDAFIVSWWGIDTYEDRVLRKMFEVAEEINSSIKITIYYETIPNNDPDKAYNDLVYVIDSYAGRKNFLKIGGYPVIFIYSRAIGQIGYFDWINVAKKLFERTKVILIMDSFDDKYLVFASGLHTYNPLPYLLEGKNLTEIYLDVAKKVRGKGLFAATVLPGYNDTVVRNPGAYYPRLEGKTYNETWKAAIKSGANWVLITSFNEWHEGTEIEPSVEYGYYYIELTRYWTKIFKEE